MSLTREAVEQVVFEVYGKHQRSVVRESKPFWDDLVEAILALVPQPSREEVIKILKDNVDASAEETRKPLVDSLMAWATGTQRTWCTHLTWKEMSGDQYDRSSGWYASKRDWCFYSGKDFKYCPFCAVPRPTK